MTTSSSERTGLVVEDQPEVRSLLADARPTLGDRVLTAAHPDDGLPLGVAHAEPIDLLGVPEHSALLVERVSGALGR